MKLSGEQYNSEIYTAGSVWLCYPASTWSIWHTNIWNKNWQKTGILTTFEPNYIQRLGSDAWIGRGLLWTNKQNVKNLKTSLRKRTNDLFKHTRRREPTNEQNLTSLQSEITEYSSRYSHTRLYRYPWVSDGAPNLISYPIHAGWGRGGGSTRRQYYCILDWKCL